MEQKQYEKLKLFFEKVSFYKEIISKELEVYDSPWDDTYTKKLNYELLDFFYELKDIIYSEWKHRNTSLINEYEGDLWNIYDVAFSNHIKHHIEKPLDAIIRDLREIIIKNKDKFCNDDVINALISEKDLSEDIKIEKIIQNSKEKFYNTDSNFEDKRDSIKALADCLEHYRESIKKTDFVKDDESALFNIANNFWIRHLNKGQKLDYDEAIFYEWIFLSYYNTLKLYLKLMKRRNEKK